MAVAPTQSLSESQALTALVAFLTGALPAGTPVVRGQVNRVSEPGADNFCIFWPILQTRLSTNVVNFYDNVIAASITGNVLTVTAIEQAESQDPYPGPGLPPAGPLTPGMVLTDGTAGALASDTQLGAQLSGSVGGTGTYTVAPTQTLGATTLYAGLRADLAPTELTVQVDVHGPLSANNALTITTLLRSEYGTDAFAASGFAVTPLYCSDPRQAPFLNEAEQVEYRWSLDACLQIDSVIGTAQDFAEVLTPTTYEVDATYPP